MEPANDKLVVWSAFVDFDDFEADLAAEYPNATKLQLRSILYDINEGYLDDVKAELQGIAYSEPILVIGQEGTWHGPVYGCGFIRSGCVSDCFNSGPAIFYVTKDGDFQQEYRHHDGTDLVRYRALKPNVTEEQIEWLTERILDGVATEEDIRKYTTGIGVDIAKRFGWQLENDKAKNEIER